MPRIGRHLGAVATLALLMASAATASADLPVRGMQRAIAQASQQGLRIRSVRHPLAAADGRIPLLVPLPPGVTAAQRGLLPLAPGFGSVHLTPSGLEAFLREHPDLEPRAAPLRRPLVNYSGKWTQANVFRNQTGTDGLGVVVGIIDTGLDVTHQDFHDEAGIRVAWLLQREAPRGVHAELEKALGCDDPNQAPCAVYSGADIDALLAGDPEKAPRDFDGHGTHVASIAAGNGRASPEGQRHFGGVAPRATLIVASPSVGGGFSDPDIIKAARFIYERAEALGMPAVVNVSLGSDFGPHDGSSALEKGLASLVGDAHPGRVMVVAAGNSGSLYRLDDRGPFGVHTEAHASPNAITRVVMEMPGARSTVDGAGFVWITFRPGDDVSVGLEGPDGTTWVPLVEPGQEVGVEDDEIQAGVINNLVNGNSQLTADSNGAVIFWDGRWDGSAQLAILLQGRGHAQLWAAGIAGAAPSSETLGLSFSRALRSGTITVPASHPDLIAVGCTINRTSWQPFGSPVPIEIGSFGGAAAEEDSVCFFSAAGPLPNGAMKPDILAPGGFVAGAMSADADPRANPASIFWTPGCPDPTQPCFMVDDSHAITSGTSMSAPHVAGAAALLLQREPTLTQADVMEILQAGAARPRGQVPFDFQQGPGELNMLGALQVLDQRLGNGAEPSLQASYFTISSPYARPDPNWHVRGLVEMRHADGTVAMDVAPSRLSLSVDGGLVAQPPTKVRAGLFRFSFAAPFGSGGTDVTVQVNYRGQSLGRRTIPVGVDAWAAEGGVAPVGGCNFAGRHAPGSAPTWPPSWPWFLLGLSCFVGSGRRALSRRKPLA